MTWFTLWEPSDGWYARLFDDRPPGVGQQESTANFLFLHSRAGLRDTATIGTPLSCRKTDLLWAPGIPGLLDRAALEQIGRPLVFFLHLGSGPDKHEQHPGVAFGVCIVFLVSPAVLVLITPSERKHMAMPESMVVTGVRAGCTFSKRHDPGGAVAAALPRIGDFWH